MVALSFEHSSYSCPKIYSFIQQYLLSVPGTPPGTRIHWSIRWTALLTSRNLHSTKGPKQKANRQINCDRLWNKRSANTEYCKEFGGSFSGMWSVKASSRRWHQSQNNKMAIWRIKALHAEATLVKSGSSLHNQLNRNYFHILYPPLVVPAHSF